jgi:hypothetical protein
LLIDWSGRLSGSPLKDADPLCKRYEFRQGLDLHFLHHQLAMGFDRALGPTYRTSDLFVGLASNDKFNSLMGALSYSMACDVFPSNR